MLPTVEPEALSMGSIQETEEQDNYTVLQQVSPAPATKWYQHCINFMHTRDCQWLNYYWK